MTLAIIIARLNSSRLPRKQLRFINGKPMIDHIIGRLREVKGIDQIILATGPKKENQDLAKHVQSVDVATYYDDDVNDVTGRIVRAGEYFNARFIVTVSGDCPLIDPSFIQSGITLLKESEADFVYIDYLKNECLHEGIEFHTQKNWERLDELSSTWYHREHPGSVLKEEKDSFTGAEITPEIDFQRHDFRMSVDTRSDLFFMNQIYHELSSEDKIVDLHDVVRLVDKKPWLKIINAHVHQKTITEKSKIFLFITQASADIGLGHLSRCMALATEFQESFGANSFFYVNSNPNTQKILEEQGFEFFAESEFGPQADVPSLLTKKKFSRIIVDVKRETLNESFGFLASTVPSSVLIDIHPDEKFRGMLTIIPAVNIDDKPNPPNCFKGKEYLILKREIQFWRNTRNVASSKHILVLSGGSGIPDSTLVKSLEIFENRVNIQFVIGPFVTRKKFEDEMKKTNLSNYDITQSPEDIFSEISKAYIVLLPFGVTAYECLTIGTPTVITSIITPSDKYIVDYLEQRNILLDLVESSNSIERMGEALLGIYYDPEKCNTLSQEARTYFKGDGVRTVAELIMGEK
jgi:spore coat polysaccharide biosynthesis protein SpsF